MGSTVNMEHSHVSKDTTGFGIILNNIQKPKNIFNLMRSAQVFGVQRVYVVGQRTFDEVQMEETFGIPCQRIDSLQACREHLLEQDPGMKIYGVEILEGAHAVTDYTFPKDHGGIFMFGNEGSGMSKPQMAICDEFLYIPQFGEGTASLNVTCAASIVLHHYSLSRK